MAPITVSSHSFQKLKLDTSVPHKPVASSFASIPRDEAQSNGIASITDLKPHLEDVERNHYSHAIPIKREENGFHAQTAYDASAVAIDSGSSEEGGGIEAQFRRRKKSISFSQEVTLDSGNRLSLEEPLPKSASHKPRSEISDGEDLSDQDYLELPLSQRKQIQKRIGEGRYPLLQTTVDELAAASEYNDHVASLTSETTASPVEEVRTPLETPTEYTLSPLPTTATSPIEFPPFLSRRQTSMRSRSYRSEIGEADGSLRRASRRSSARSGRSLSSMSPAASFLARYKTSEALKPTEPDDEGQGIGYESEYIIGKQIGYGGFSVVKEVTSIEDGQRVVNAVKIVRRQLKNKNELENEQIQTQFDHEVEIWRFLRHPYILPLLRVYTTEFATFCITMLNKGGTLFDLVRDTRKQKKNGLSKHLARRYIYQLASAMRYLHNDVQVVHRDIKLENCLVDMSGPNASVEGGNLLLCDFGMADFIVSDQRDGPDPQSVDTNQNIGPAQTSTSVAGSLQYAAPELFGAPSPVFSPAADVWAFGVVAYALITASLPFNEGLDMKTAAKIQRGEFDIERLSGAEAVKDGGIEDVLALIKGCIHMNPQERWTVHDILECSWLRGCAEQYENASRPWILES